TPGASPDAPGGSPGRASDRQSGRASGGGHGDTGADAAEEGTAGPSNGDPASLSVRITDGGDGMAVERATRALAELTREGVALADFTFERPSLDEVFLALTGHRAGTGGGEGNGGEGGPPGNEDAAEIEGVTEDPHGPAGSSAGGPVGSGTVDGTAVRSGTVEGAPRTGPPGGGPAPG
ncbi:hypothetical protein DZF91_22665, partial [Actinomadura logoneensis]